MARNEVKRSQDQIDLGQHSRPLQKFWLLFWVKWEPLELLERGGTRCDLCFPSVPLVAIISTDTFREATAFAQVRDDRGSNLEVAGEK